MTESETHFNPGEYLRYSRHLSLPGFGLEGQRKLKQASVLVVGTGGLGSPVAIYLAAAGIGCIGLVDHDVVDLSNLQRQVLFSSNDVGKSKLEAAKTRLEKINSEIQIITHEGSFSSHNAMKMLSRYDLVFDCTDNFPTRYLINDVSVFLGKPNIYGSIFRFDGQVSIFCAKDGPCYRCLYEVPPPPGSVPSCAEGGVLGVLPGIVGSIQVTEAIKWITGIGEPLIGRLLLIDALSMTFKEIGLQKNRECVVCGEVPTIKEPVDYEAFCNVSGTSETVTVPEIDVHRVKQKLDRGEEFTILDIRERWEWQIAHLDKTLFIPMKLIPSHLEELNPSREIVVHCHTGQRSATVTEFLIQHGYRNVKSMSGGIKAWTEEIDPGLNLY